jgi:hypothetical protein
VPSGYVWTKEEDSDLLKAYAHHTEMKHKAMWGLFAFHYCPRFTGAQVYEHWYSLMAKRRAKAKRDAEASKMKIANDDRRFLKSKAAVIICLAFPAVVFHVMHTNITCSGLTEGGFKLHKTQGDGNCLFRAVAFGLSGSESNHLDFRRTCVTFMRDNAGKYLNNGEMFSSFSRGPWETHCRRMDKPCEWGDHPEILALSGAFKCTIYVHKYDRKPEVIKWPGNDLVADDDFIREIHISQ